MICYLGNLLEKREILENKREGVVCWAGKVQHKNIISLTCA
jgi:hypothetical protein